MDAHHHGATGLQTREDGQIVAVVAVAFIIATMFSIPASADTDIHQRLADAIRAAICQRTHFATEQVDVKPCSIRLPEGSESATGILVSLPEYENPFGSLTVRATFDRGDRVLGTIPVPVRVEVYDDVLVATRRLSRHEVIGERDLVTERRAITQCFGSAMTAVDSVIGKRVEKTVNKGETIDRRWLADVPEIHRGDRVTIAYVTGGVRVTTTAQAIEDGYRDQTIKVKPNNGSKLMSVRVVDAGTVTPLSR